MSSQIPVVVTGAVGLGVPSIAALWARANQARQLQHDHQVRDLEELRRVLDDAAELLAEAVSIETKTQAARRWNRLVETNEAGHLSKKALDGQRELMTSRLSIQQRSLAMQARLAMRLGRDAPVTTLHRVTLRLLEQLTTVVDAQTNRDHWQKLGHALEESRAAFVDAATVLVASRLPSPPE